MKQFRRFSLIIVLFLPLTLISQVLFSDITSDLTSFNVKTADSWGSGVTAEDYDKDGDIDLVLCSDASSNSLLLVNKLYHNGVKGKLEFEVRPLGFNFHTRVGMWFDYNGDHRLDLLFAGDCLSLGDDCNQTIILFEQQENGDLINVTEKAGLLGAPYAERGPMSGVAIGDMNEDGFLDVIIPFFNRLSIYLENQGDGTFKKIFDKFDVGRQKNWTPVIFDINQDGWVDYYQAVDLGWPNQFWTHNGDMNFADKAELYGINHQSDDMGVNIGDYDQDGYLDIYVTNIENEFKGNVLLRNSENQMFDNVAYDVGVASGGWGWGVTSLDANNDGWLDIATTNGFEIDEYDQSKLWLNLGNGSFQDISEESQFNDTLMATSLISIDLDRDGDLDLIQTLKSQFHDQGFRFLENQLAHNTNENFIVIQPRMEGSNHWAIGSLVRIKTKSGDQLRPITAGIGYFSQEPAEAFFGIGSDTEIDEIVISWPGGGKTKINNVLANQVIQISDENALHPPRNLQSKIIPQNSILLSWDPTSTIETSYLIERSIDSLFESYEQFEIESDQYEYLDESLELGATYYYRVRAKSSDEISRSTLHIRTGVTEEVKIPENLFSKNLSVNSVKISWTDLSDNENSFIIQRSGNESFDSFIEFELPKNSQDFIDTNLEPNSVYYYRIRAVGEFGISSFTESIKVDLSIGVLAIESLEAFLIYPNPSSGIINFNLNMDIVEEVVITNLNGITLEKFNPKSSVYKLSNRYAKGQYLLRVKIDTKWITTSILIEQE